MLYKENSLLYQLLTPYQYSIQSVLFPPLGSTNIILSYGPEPFATPKKEKLSFQGKLILPQPELTLPSGKLIGCAVYVSRMDAFSVVVLRPQPDGGYTVVFHEEYEPYDTDHKMIIEPWFDVSQ